MAEDNPPAAWQLCCPVPIASDSLRISLAHGEGGRLSRALIRNHILPTFRNDVVMTLDDAAHLPSLDGPVAMTTDSFVVSPLFFPGGDIGSLAIHGTVNDLAVSGARPRYISLSLILEEGLPIAVLDLVMESAANAAAEAEVLIVTGDTKVVPRGAADGLFINTTGIGELVEPAPPGPTSLQVGDELIVSGPIGRHGVAVLTAREELEFSPPPESDSASLVKPIDRLRRELGDHVRAIRDATRGGVAAVLHEWAEASGMTLAIEEQQIPVTPVVRGVCELLGLDPIHIANEGTMVIAVAAGAAEAALSALRADPLTSQAAQIGTVVPRGVAAVTIQRPLGPQQPLDEPAGAPLPRIC